MIKPVLLLSGQQIPLHPQILTALSRTANIIMLGKQPTPPSTKVDYRPCDIHNSREVCDTVSCIWSEYGHIDQWINCQDVSRGDQATYQHLIKALTNHS